MKSCEFVIRWLIGLVVIAAAMLQQQRSAIAAEPFRLRVLSYNIHHGEGIDRKLDLNRIAEVILSVKPDLVALQEVDQTTRRTGGVDQAAELARLTKMHFVFGGNISFQGGRYGNAVLSRYPIGQQTNHLLPNIDSGEQRGVMEVEINLPGENPSIVLLATHLDHRSDEQERLASASVINALIEGNPDRPMLLAGDLNAGFDSKTLMRLREHWHPSNKVSMPTVPVKHPTRQIDFILYRPLNRWRVLEVQVLDEAIASDHRAVFASLALEDREPGK